MDGGDAKTSPCRYFNATEFKNGYRGKFCYVYFTTIDVFGEKQKQANIRIFYLYLIPISRSSKRFLSCQMKDQVYILSSPLWNIQLIHQTKTFQDPFLPIYFTQYWDYFFFFLLIYGIATNPSRIIYIIKLLPLYPPQNFLFSSSLKEIKTSTSLQFIKYIYIHTLNRRNSAYNSKYSHTLYCN